MFDNSLNILKNEKGVLLDNKMNIINNIFTVGWVKTGPKGIIESTLRDSYETVSSIISAVEKNLLKEINPDYNEIIEQIQSAGKRVIKKEDWKIINRYEEEEGFKKGKVREKFIKLDDMLKII